MAAGENSKSNSPFFSSQKKGRNPSLRLRPSTRGFWPAAWATKAVEMARSNPRANLRFMPKNPTMFRDEHSRVAAVVLQAAQIKQNYEPSLQLGIRVQLIEA